MITSWNRGKTLAGLFAAALLAAAPALAEDREYVVYEGGKGPGEGKHIVLISGDDEYRSEELLPQLGKILSERHGFKCTVLFPIDPETGEIVPDHQTNIPGTHHLNTADLMIIMTRFRNLPNTQMAPIDAYVNAGKPVIGLRTATHAFNISDGPYEHYSWNYGGDNWPGGFGQQVLGETWVNHHGVNSQEATRGRIAEDGDEHPIFNSVEDDAVYCTTNVYEVRESNLEDASILLLGQILEGMDQDDAVADDERNEPLMPVAWLREYRGLGGPTGQAFTTTMGSSRGFEASEDFRRMIVNAAYYLLDLDVPDSADVDIVGEYETLPFAFDGYAEGVRPIDHAMD